MLIPPLASPLPLPRPPCSTLSLSSKREICALPQLTMNFVWTRCIFFGYSTHITQTADNRLWIEETDYVVIQPSASHPFSRQQYFIDIQHK
jgi:hypothetical protein